ncbi:DUF262 domain-containing protein [Serratia sp. Se-RSBMAAmG]|uniref:DUF262 domain-containing protein n=1 Tax=Serratia sp. Se-RSBMAAmG TaxID=3043305 RepID=UPI0024AEB1C4|nr:DUF262 domain-containing protein [Serratia sp. Se-RSBMAAmG]MDI6977181.1 DUF262 domain-containing protein [Serratia sp. Se-RSBMAAmG]
MENRVKAARCFDTSSADLTVDSWISFIENDRLNLDAAYQRDYVWRHTEQNMFLLSVVRGAPLSAISVVKTYNNRGNFILEVVDGKQRLTTLKKFLNNEIPVRLNQQDVYYRDFNSAERNSFSAVALPKIELRNATTADKLKFFLSINFTGVPQSEEHHKKVLTMLGETAC